MDTNYNQTDCNQNGYIGGSISLRLQIVLIQNNSVIDYAQRTENIFFSFRFRKSHKSPPQEKKPHKIPWFSESNPLILGLPSTVFPIRLFYKYLQLNSKNK